MTISAELDLVRECLGDRYAIERELGRGGMGTVYLARDLRLDRLVALKVLPATDARDTVSRERFVRETRTAASFSHPNIVPVHAVDERDDLVAFAMGYVEGESLGQRVGRLGPLGLRDLVRLLQDIGYALAYAHGRGVVHRDLKPDNVMIERATGRALLMDFGIARSMTVSPAAVAVGITRVGEVIGTPEYMSPEQASGEAVDGRSDLYSFGLVAFFAATGQIAMGGSTPQRILVRQLTEEVPALSRLRPDLPAALSAAIDRCVRKEPGERFASAEALVEAVDDTQLAAPSIPLSIRGFAQELRSATLVLDFVALLTWFMLRVVPRTLTVFERALPITIGAGVALACLGQAYASARRLAELGFTPAETLGGLHATVDEQRAQREDLRLDPTVHRRRRTAIVAGWVMIGAACGIGVLGLKLLTTVTLRQLTLALAITMLGMGLVVLLRSPFRMSPTEWTFRRLWLGPVGRRLVTLSARGMERRSQPAVRHLR